MQKIKELDVRPLIPIKRHEKLLSLFKDLPAGESFVFINDHDPKPLYYEFRSIYGDVVGWDYLQRRSEEHTSELQSRGHLVCRLLLEKNNMPSTVLRRVMLR